MSDGERPTDAERLTAVLDILEKRGARAMSLEVGDIRVGLATPWPAPPGNPQAQNVAKDEAMVDPETRKLREWSRKQFGRVLSDEMLRTLAPVI